MQCLKFKTHSASKNNSLIFGGLEARLEVQGFFQTSVLTVPSCDACAALNVSWMCF